MVAVTLSAEVRPPPSQVGGTTGGGTEGQDMASLKAAARQHVDASMASAGGAEEHAAPLDSRPQGQKNPYLTPDIAKSIACRFFPNCHYGDGCMFWHPPALVAHPGSVANGSFEHGAHKSNGHVNGQSGSSASSPAPHAPGASSPVVNGNGHSHGNSIDALTGFDYAAQQGQQQQQMMYYIPNGYDGASPTSPEAAAYMQYAAQGLPPQQQQMNGGSHSQGHSRSHSRSQSQNQAQLAPNYYGFVPYANGAAVYGNGYPQPYMQHTGYYAQQQQYPAGMYMPQGAHANGNASTSATSPAISDPAIIAQGPESARTANAHPAGTTATAGSAKMEKSSSNQSAKSAKSTASSTGNAASTTTKSAKNKKQQQGKQENGASSPDASASAALPNGHTSPQPASQGQFVPMPYYPMHGVPLGAGMPNFPPEAAMQMPMMMPPSQHYGQYQQHQGMAFSAASGAYNGAAAVQQPPMSPSSLDAAFAKASLTAAGNGDAASPSLGTNGDLPGAQAPSSQINGKKNGHGKTPSITAAQMHTFFQTTDETAEPTAGETSQQQASASTRGPASTRGVPAAQLNGAYHPTGPRASGPSTSNGPTGKRAFPTYGGAGSNGRGGAPSHHIARTGARPSFDPSRPVPNCRYFETRSCKHGDMCHWAHYLTEERVIPGDAEGKTTRDARMLGLNIIAPDGTVGSGKPNGEFKKSMSGGHPSWANANGPLPHVNAKGRFTHPNGHAFAQQHAQQQAIASLANGNAHTGDAQEKIQRLISETRNLPSSPSTNTQTVAPISSQPPAPRSPSRNTASGSASAAPHTRNPPISAMLAAAQGGRRPPASQQQQQRGISGPRNAQRIPSGENDFPALSAGAPAPAASGTSVAMDKRNSSSGAGAPDAKAEPVKSAASAVANGVPAAPSAPAAQKPQATEAATSSSAPAASTPAAAPSHPNAAGAPAAVAPAKPTTTFSWASAAAKAASLPTPPAPKRAPSKPRGSAAASAAASKDGKADNNKAKSDGKKSDSKDAQESKSAEVDGAAAATPETGAVEKAEPADASA